MTIDHEANLERVRQSRGMRAGTYKNKKGETRRLVAVVSPKMFIGFFNMTTSGFMVVWEAVIPTKRQDPVLRERTQKICASLGIDYNDNLWATVSSSWKCWLGRGWTKEDGDG